MEPYATAPPPALPAPSNGLATAGFVIALVGAVFSLIPLIGVVAWLLCPIGLILSLVGVAASGARGSGRGLGVAGVVLSGAGLLMCLFYAAMFAAAFAPVR